VAHVALEHADEKADDVLEEDLELAGTFDTQLRADGKAEHQDDEDDQDAEDDVVRRVDAKRREKRVDQLDQGGRVFNGFHNPSIVVEIHKPHSGSAPDMRRAPTKAG
jgi:hypothetical protein